MTIARGAAALLTAIALAATAACTGSVQGSDVEAKVVQAADKQGVEVKDVSCADLTAEKGERTTCTLTVQDEKYRLVVEVRSVEGAKVDYVIKAPTAVG